MRVAMAMSMAGRMFVVAMVVALVAQCGSAQVSGPPPGPLSRNAPYTVTVDAGQIATVVESGDFVVLLQSNPCAITVGEFFSNSVPHLIWTANYYVGSVENATKCTLKFTSAGDLQLFALYRGKNILIWHSDTAGKGIVKMALEDVIDDGDFQLLTAANVVKYQSFDVKEFSILATQKLRPWETLWAPNVFFIDGLSEVLFSGRTYFLQLHSGDLRLYSDFGKGPKQYWSVQQTLAKNVDVRQVAYATMVSGGIGLVTSNGTLVWTSGALPPLETDPTTVYLSVDPDGNLRTYYLLKGNFWEPYFVAIPNLCDLPNSCGAYGVCSNSKCSCLPQWVARNSKDLTQGCKRSTPFAKCRSGKQQFVSFTGYDSVYNQYAAGLKISQSACELQCYRDYNCAAYFYNAHTYVCYLSNEVRTLRKVSDTKLSVHLKICLE